MPVADPYAGLRCTLGQVSLAIYPAGATFGPRLIADYEFVWIVAGDVVWDCDGVQHAMPAGGLVLVRPGMRDSFIWDPKRVTRHGFIHFSILERGVGLPPESTWPLVRQLGDGDIIGPLLRHLAWLQAVRPEGWERHAQMTFTQVLVAFISGATGTLNDEGTGRSPVIERVIGLIREAWGDGTPRQVAVTRLAKLAGISRGHLIRIFSDQLGMGPAEAQRLLRLDRAATLLARTNMRVQDVAEETGFANPFHFTRAFHTTYGCAPREFRRRCAQGMPVPINPLAESYHVSSRLWR